MAACAWTSARSITARGIDSRHVSISSSALRTSFGGLFIRRRAPRDVREPLGETERRVVRLGRSRAPAR